MLYSQGLFKILILSRIDAIPGIIPIYSRSFLLSSSHLHLGLSKDLFPVGLPVTILKAFILFGCMTWQF